MSPSLPLRRSGTDWQDTLSLIRQMAWGETLIWTSSAWKRTVLPGWAQRGREQPITTHSCCRHTAWFFPLKCVCVCVDPVVAGPSNSSLHSLLFFFYYYYFYCCNNSFIFLFHTVCQHPMKLQYQNGVTEGRSRLNRRWIKVCALFGPHVVPSFLCAFIFSSFCMHPAPLCSLACQPCFSPLTCVQRGKVVVFDILLLLAPGFRLWNFIITQRKYQIDVV